MLIFLISAFRTACLSLLSSVRYCDAVIVPLSSCEAAAAATFFRIVISSSSLSHFQGEHALQRFLCCIAFYINELLLESK
jgi:hypothetical protein